MIFNQLEEEISRTHKRHDTHLRITNFAHFECNKWSLIICTCQRQYGRFPKRENPRWKSAQWLYEWFDDFFFEIMGVVYGFSHYAWGLGVVFRSTCAHISVPFFLLRFVCFCLFRWSIYLSLLAGLLLWQICDFVVTPVGI